MKSKKKSKLFTFITIATLYFLYVIYSTPRGGYIYERDTMMNIMEAKNMLSNGLNLNGWWSYTLNNFHPSPLYSYILLIGGLLSEKIFNRSFDMGASALMSVALLAILLLNYILLKNLISTRLLRVVLITTTFLLYLPRRTDLFKFADPSISNVYLNLNFINIIMVTTIISTLFLYSELIGKEKTSPLVIYLSLALSANYLPIFLINIALLLPYILITLINNYKKDEVKKIVNIVLAITLASSPIIYKIFFNRETLYNKLSKTRVDEEVNILSNLNEVIKFHTFNLPSIVYFLSIIALLMLGKKYMFNKKEIEKNIVSLGNLILGVANLILLGFIVISHPSKSSLYLSTYITTIFIVNIVMILEQIYSENKRIKKSLLYIVFIVIEILILILIPFNIKLEEVKYENRYNIDSGVKNYVLNTFSYDKKEDFEVEYIIDRADYNANMFYPSILRILNEEGYSACVRDEKSLKFFNCKKSESDKIVLIKTDKAGNTPKNVNIIYPISSSEINESQANYIRSRRSFWPTMSDIDRYLNESNSKGK